MVKSKPGKQEVSCRYSDTSPYGEYSLNYVLIDTLAENTYHKGKDHYKASLQVTGSALTKQENVICGN